MNLAVKYRPKKFEDVSEQKLVVNILESLCESEKLDNRNFLLVGPAGTGKTTLARIIADRLNSGQGEPIEIDAASHNGVESVRDIVQQARSYPLGCNYKVFIIDECFPGDTKVKINKTDRKSIKDIKPGDEVQTLFGPSKVQNAIHNQVKPSELIRVNFTDGYVITTKHHLFFTNDGWVEASELVQNDKLYTPESIGYIKPTQMYKEQFKYDDRFCAYVEIHENDNMIEFRSVPDLYKYGDQIRGGWIDPTEEYGVVKTAIVPKLKVVESIEAYKRDVNEESFKEYLSEEELHSDYVTLYDLEIEDHPSYYANGVLVHNCHSFSNQAWQVMLKTFEESPAKSVFILATTNPEKIPGTILSRVQTFQLSKISLDGIINRLKYVLNEEIKEGRPIQYEEDAVSFIAKLANGGMRDSLTLLDKALAYSTNLTMQTVSLALDLPNYDNYFELLGAYAKKDNKTIAKIIHDVYNCGTNFIKWFESFHSFVMNVVKYILLQDISFTMIPTHYQDKISNYSNSHLVICLKLANKLITMNNELKSTQYLQEVALTHLCSIPKPKKGAQ